MEEFKEKFRTFVAVEFPEKVLKEVARVQGILGKVSFVGKMTELENLHLTLKFLGEISGEKLERVRRRLKEVEFEEMDLRLGDIGIFNFKGKPRIVWIKILGKEIYDLQKKIDSVLEKEGFEKEIRFMGHVTIARVKYAKNKRGSSERVRGIKTNGEKFSLKEFRLKKSDLRDLGPVYTDVEVYKCGEK